MEGGKMIDDLEPNVEKEEIVDSVDRAELADGRTICPISTSKSNTVVRQPAAELCYPEVSGFLQVYTNPTTSFYYILTNEQQLMLWIRPKIRFPPPVPPLKLNKTQKNRNLS